MVDTPIADLQGGRIVLKASPRLREKVKSIPGARYQAKTETWSLSPGWLTALALRQEFPDLQITDALNEWGWQKRKKLERQTIMREPEITTPFNGLYSFQNDGAWFLLEGERAILADDMGLGKTVQAIVALSSVKFHGGLPAIVVSTNSMLLKWAAEFEKWAPELEVRVVAGSASKRRVALEPGADVYIVGWATVRYHSRLGAYGSIALSDEERRPKELNVLNAQTVIVDEAHRMVDPKAKQTRAVWALQHTARYRWSLTGTPTTNSVENIWAILHGVAPEEFPSRSGFISRYTLSGTNYFGGLEIFGINPTHRQELFTVVDSLMLRRTKAEVALDLPPKLYTVVPVELTTKQRKAYDQMEKHLMAGVDGAILMASNPLVRDVRLLQIAAATPVIDEASGTVMDLTSPSSKIDALRDIIESAPGEPLVIFTVSKLLANLVIRELQHTGLRVVSITGDVSNNQRQSNVDSFQGGEADYIVCTVAAGGEGITLTRASKVVFLQRSFSMVQDRQAEDRVHRIGQEAESVQIIDVVSTDTNESDVFEAMYRKGEHFESVVRDQERVG